jgi:hypothetical protein
VDRRQRGRNVEHPFGRLRINSTFNIELPMWNGFAMGLPIYY